MLDVLDSGSERGQVYRALAELGRCDPGRLARHCGLSTMVVGRVLDELAELDTARRVPGEAGLWEARSPGQVMAEVLRLEETRRARLWQAGAELDQLYQAARRNGDECGHLEVISDPAEMIATTRRLQRRATEQVRWLDRPPYHSRREQFETQEALQAKRMAAGLRYRTVYHQAVYDDPALFDGMARMVDLGEEARVLADLPIKLTIGDDDVGMLVPEPDRWGVEGLLVLHASGLLNAFIGIFETLWTLGVPITATGRPQQLSEQDRKLITLMAAGVTDEAIARRLRLSRRTVVRRVTALLDRLGASTRFQAGVQAAKRGWFEHRE